MGRRLFFGLELPDAWKEGIRIMQQGLQRKSVEAGAWSNPQLLHITVLFLGIVEDAEMSSIQLAGEAAATGISPIRLATGRFGQFARNKVLWLGLDREGTDWPALVELNRRVTDGVLANTPVNFHLDHPQYRPHITLARKVRQQVNVERLPRPESMETVVTELSLFESLRVDGELTYPVRERFMFTQDRK